MKITRSHLRRLIREVVLAETGDTIDRAGDRVAWQNVALGSPISRLDVEESRIDLSAETRGMTPFPECCTSTLKLYVAGSDRGLITREIGLSLLNIISSSLRSELFTFQGIEHLKIDPIGEEAVSVVYQGLETVRDILSDPVNLNRQKSKIRSLLPDLEEQIIDFLEHSAGAYRRVSSPGRLRRHRLDLKLVVTIDHQADAYRDGF